MTVGDMVTVGVRIEVDLYDKVKWLAEHESQNRLIHISGNQWITRAIKESISLHSVVCDNCAERIKGEPIRDGKFTFCSDHCKAGKDA